MKRTLILLTAMLAAGIYAANYDPELPWKYDTSGRSAPVVLTGTAVLADFNVGEVHETVSGLTSVEARQFWEFICDEAYACDFTPSSFTVIIR